MACLIRIHKTFHFFTSNSRHPPSPARIYTHVYSHRVQQRVTLKGSVALTAQELCDALRLHTGAKPPYPDDVPPIGLETNVLLCTLKDKQEELKYKVKLSADVSASLYATAPSRWYVVSVLLQLHFVTSQLVARYKKSNIDSMHAGKCTEA